MQSHRIFPQYNTAVPCAKYKSKKIGIQCTQFKTPTYLYNVPLYTLTERAREREREEPVCKWER